MYTVWKFCLKNIFLFAVSNLESNALMAWHNYCIHGNVKLKNASFSAEPVYGQQSIVLLYNDNFY